MQAPRSKVDKNRVGNPSPEAAFKTLVGAFNGRVRRCNHLNPFAGWEMREGTGTYKGYRVRVGMTGAHFSVGLDGPETSLCFSLGAPAINGAVYRRMPSPRSLRSWRLFTRADFKPTDVRDWLRDPQNVLVLQALNCSESRSLHLYCNGLVFYTDSNQATPKLLDALVAVAQKQPRTERASRPGVKEIEGLELDPKKLPSPLRLLVPHIARWAIGDDVDRERKLARAKRAQATKLLSDTTPLLKRINRYLDSFGDAPLPDEAILIGRLAEAVAELQIRAAD